MLEAHIVKQQGRVRVQVDFSCGDGCLLALTGPSGCGKTTIIRALAGLIQPDKGSIKYGRTDWYNRNKKIFLQPRKRKVGYVFQEHTLFPHLSVRKNIGFACKDQKRITALLELLRIRHLEDSKPGVISGGERQRTALAQALASTPDVLLLDEPFSALDSQTRSRLCTELLQLKKQLGIPIILVTHDLNEARLLADQHIYLEQKTTVTSSQQASINFGHFSLTTAPA